MCGLPLAAGRCLRTWHTAVSVARHAHKCAAVALMPILNTVCGDARKRGHLQAEQQAKDHYTKRFDIHRIYAVCDKIELHRVLFQAKMGTGYLYLGNAD